MQEARHRPAIEAERTRRHQQIGTLEGRIAEGRTGREIGIGEIARPAVDGVRGQEFEMVEEAAVDAEDGGDWRRHGLVDIARLQATAQPLLGFGRDDEDDALRTDIVAGRRHAGERVQLAQLCLRDGAGQPGVMGAGLAEEQVQAPLGECFA